MDGNFYFELIEYTARLQKRAGKMMLEADGKIFTEEKSSGRDVVTKYDRAVQELLMRGLGGKLPDAEFFCEELKEEGNSCGKQVFIIDPIDGTMNFVKGLHHSCISVAYAENGKVMAASIYNPYTDEVFSSVRGIGAFVNGRTCRVADDGLGDSIVHFGTSPYYPQMAEKTFSLAGKAYSAGLDVRRRGSAALDLCDVAAGRAGLYFEMRLSLWDFAAGMLLVQEAGGICTALDGTAMPLDGSKTSIIAGGRKAVSEFSEYLK